MLIIWKYLKDHDPGRRDMTMSRSVRGRADIVTGT